MAKPTYRLQPVLEQREREKDEANRRLLELREAVVYEEKKLEKLIEMRKEIDRKKEACTEKLQEIMTQPGVNLAEEAIRHDRYQEVLDREAAAHDQAVAQQRQAVRHAEKRVLQGEEALLQATVNVQAMEKHKGQWAHGVKVEELRKEQEIQEELGEVMWLQQRRDNERRG